MFSVGEISALDPRHSYIPFHRLQSPGTRLTYPSHPCRLFIYIYIDLEVVVAHSRGYGPYAALKNIHGVSSFSDLLYFIADYARAQTF